MLSEFSLYISRKDNIKIHGTVKISTANTYHPKKQKAWEITRCVSGHAE